MRTPPFLPTEDFVSSDDRVAAGSVDRERLAHFLSISISLSLSLLPPPPPPPPPPPFPLFKFFPLSLSPSLSPYLSLPSSSPLLPSPSTSPNLNAREAVVVDVILFQDSAPIVIEIDPYLLPTVNSVVSKNWMAASRDPHTS